MNVEKSIIWKEQLGKEILYIPNGVLEYAFTRLVWNNLGINIDADYLSHLHFADDIVQTTDNLGDAH